MKLNKVDEFPTSYKSANEVGQIEGEEMIRLK